MITLKFKREFDEEESRDFATAVLISLLSDYDLDNIDDSTLLSAINDEATELISGYGLETSDTCLIPIKEELKKILKKLEELL